MGNQAADLETADNMTEWQDELEHLGFVRCILRHICFDLTLAIAMAATIIKNALKSQMAL